MSTSSTATMPPSTAAALAALASGDRSASVPATLEPPGPASALGDADILANLARDVIELIAQLIDKLASPVRAAIVTGVDGDAVTVQEQGDDTSGQQRIRFSGPAPAVGQLILIITTPAKRDYAVSLNAAAALAGVNRRQAWGQFNASSVYGQVQSDPTLIVAQYAGGLAMTATGPDQVNVGVRWGSGLNDVPRGNHTHAYSDLTGTPPATEDGSGKRDTWLIYTPLRTVNVTKQIPVSATGTFTVAAGRTYFIPVTFAESVSIDQIGVEVTTAVAGTTYVSVWSTEGEVMDNHMIRPHTRISGVGSFSTSTVGAKTGSFTAVDLAANTVYLLAMRFGSACQVRFGNPALDVMSTGTMGSADRCAMGFIDSVSTAMTQVRPGIDTVTGTMIIMGWRQSSTG